MIWTLTMAFALERRADRADAAVHHVGRRDDVGARRRLVQRLVDQHVDGLVVEHIAGVVDQPVLAVAV